MPTSPTVVRLPRLPLNWNKQPQLFERYWDEAMKNIEKTLNGILQIPVIQEGLNGTIAASQKQSIATSFPVGLTITVTDAGVVTISDHLRRYTDGHADVAVTGAVITTGLSSGDIRSIGYDDVNRAGGAVTYILFIDDLDAHYSLTNPGRHYVGFFAVPDTGSPPDTGGGGLPPGGSPIRKLYGDVDFDGGEAAI